MIGPAWAAARDAGKIASDPVAAGKNLIPGPRVQTTCTMELFDEMKSDVFAGVITSKIHIRTQNMGRKWVTTIDGLDEDLDLERIAKAMKKSLHCSTTVIKDKDENEVIQLQGNHSDVLKQWLIEMQILTEKEAADRLIVHGSV